mmetsp:Transcript_50516/g.105525  ORF Transcript_50516/g.105525 Transcript_50516/m.105525 type:complete len:235 (-) Transcript_50516:475-1179(-)
MMARKRPAVCRKRYVLLNARATDAASAWRFCGVPSSSMCCELACIWLTSGADDTYMPSMYSTSSPWLQRRMSTTCRPALRVEMHWKYPMPTSVGMSPYACSSGRSSSDATKKMNSEASMARTKRERRRVCRVLKRWVVMRRGLSRAKRRAGLSRRRGSAKVCISLRRARRQRGARVFPARMRTVHQTYTPFLSMYWNKLSDVRTKPQLKKPVAVMYALAQSLLKPLCTSSGGSS